MRENPLFGDVVEIIVVMITLTIGHHLGKRDADRWYAKHPSPGLYSVSPSYICDPGDIFITSNLRRFRCVEYLAEPENHGMWELIESLPEFEVSIPLGDAESLATLEQIRTLAGLNHQEWRVNIHTLDSGQHLDWCIQMWSDQSNGKIACGSSLPYALNIFQTIP